MKKKCLLFLLTFALARPFTAIAQAPPLSADQQQIFDSAKQDYGQRHYKDALAKMRTLHELIPSNALITSATAETALTASDPQYALSILKPLITANPSDWQAHTFLARAYAETQQKSARDAEIQTLLEMHKTTANPQFKQLQQFLLESVPISGGHIEIYCSLTPWSRYNIYAMARVFNSTGQQQLRITLESSDFDQPLWAKQHPDLAAKGLREFSLDGYIDQVGANGQKTQTHATYAFLDGQPTYDDLRQRFLTIAEGKNGPMSTTSGIPMSKQ